MVVGRLPFWAWRVQEHLRPRLETTAPPRSPPSRSPRNQQFTAMVVNVWLECLDSTSPYPCILAIGDSTSAIGWLFRSSKLAMLPGTGHDAHLFIARTLATVLINHDTCIASQHIKGELNVVADFLSFSGLSEREKPHPLVHDNPPNDILTLRFLDELTEQVPVDFAISQLPREVLSFVSRVLQIAALSLGVARNPATRTPTECGDDGTDFVGQTGLGPTLSSLCYPSTNVSFSQKPFSSATKSPAGTCHETLSTTVKAQWSRALCAKPQATSPRRSGAIYGTAPCTSRTEPKGQQRAITPKLLRSMFVQSGATEALTKDTMFAILSELAIMAYFFAMRSCEFTLPAPLPGRTKVIHLWGIVFRDKSNQEVDHRSPSLHQAERVTLTFENQKNGQKMDRRTHQRTGDPFLCPIQRIAFLVERIYRRVPSTSPDTPINTMFLLSNESLASGTALRNYIWSSCTCGGGKPTFGFLASDLGIQSIRSSAAMSLFLMNHTIHKIMILGRWSSDAFLVYLRPQVLEWTNQMSCNMIHIDSFKDATDPRCVSPSDPRTHQKLFNGGSEPDRHPVKMLEMHLHH